MSITLRHPLFLFITLLLLSLNGCAEAIPAHTNRAASHIQTGYATLYGTQWHGRKTASGERLNIHAMTAAHRTLPFGTHVRVTLLSTGESVIVRINDRGPFVKGRIIDLTDDAAKKIGLTQKMGAGKVTIEVVK